MSYNVNNSSADPGWTLLTAYVRSAHYLCFIYNIIYVNVSCTLHNTAR